MRVTLPRGNVVIAVTFAGLLAAACGPSGIIGPSAEDDDPGIPEEDTDAGSVEPGDQDGGSPAAADPGAWPSSSDAGPRPDSAVQDLRPEGDAIPPPPPRPASIQFTSTFESGALTGWKIDGSKVAVTALDPHTGKFAARMSLDATS